MVKEKRMMNFVILISIFIIILTLSIFIKMMSGEDIDRSLLDVQKKGVLHVGTSLPFEPMEYYDDSGNIIGFDIDLINEIAKEIGVHTVIKDIRWKDLFEAAKSGESDVIIDGITITSERMEDMLFSAPYFNGGQVIVVRSDNEDITKPEDLMGKKIGVVEATTGEEAALKYADISTVFRYRSLDIVVDRLKSKDIDAMVIDYIGATGSIKNEPSLKLREGQFTEEYYGIATKLGNEALMDEINRILREMKRDGRLEQLEDKWLR